MFESEIVPEVLKLEVPAPLAATAFAVTAPPAGAVMSLTGVKVAVDMTFWPFLAVIVCAACVVDAAVQL